MEYNDIIFIFFALIAEIIGTVSGFGSSILFIPLASFFFDFKSVLIITAIFHVFSNMFKMFLFHKGFKREIILPIAIPAILFVIFGAFISKYFSTQFLELGMNFVLIFLAIYLLIYINKEIKAKSNSLIIGGAASGFIAGFIGTGGAIRGIVLSAYRLPKDVFIACSAFIDFGVDTSRSIVYFYNGYFDWKQIKYIVILIAISFIGSYLGKIILNYISEIFFRWLVLVVIILTLCIELYKILFL